MTNLLVQRKKNHASSDISIVSSLYCSATLQKLFPVLRTKTTFVNKIRLLVSATWIYIYICGHHLHQWELCVFMHQCYCAANSKDKIRSSVAALLKKTALRQFA